MTGPLDPAVFRQAAQVIRERGLTKGTFGDEYGARCTVGALQDVKAAHWRHLSPEMCLLADLIGTPAQGCPAEVTPGFAEVTNWNDALGRTADDVITLLEQAAEKLEADR